MYNREGEQMEKEEYKKISEVIYIIDRSSLCMERKKKSQKALTDGLHSRNK